MALLASWGLQGVAGSSVAIRAPRVAQDCFVTSIPPCLQADQRFLDLLGYKHPSKETPGAAPDLGGDASLQGLVPPKH